jgi:hypothetical protein
MKEKRFPQEMTNLEIQVVIDSAYHLAKSHGMKPGVVQFELERARLGIEEIKERKQKKQNLVTLSVSFLALFITTVATFADYIGDKKWQSEQLQELRLIREFAAEVTQ